MKLKKSPVIKIWERILSRVDIVFRDICKKQEAVQSGTWYSLGKQKGKQVAVLLSSHRKLQVFVAWSIVQECKKRRKLAVSVAKTVSLTRSRIISIVSAVWGWWRWWSTSAVIGQAVRLKPPPPSCQSRQAVLRLWWSRTRWDRCHPYSRFHCQSHWSHHLVQRSEENRMKALG